MRTGHPRAWAESIAFCICAHQGSLELSLRFRRGKQDQPLGGTTRWLRSPHRTILRELLNESWVILNLQSCPAGFCHCKRVLLTCTVFPKTLQIWMSILFPSSQQTLRMQHRAKIASCEFNPAGLLLGRLPGTREHHANICNMRDLHKQIWSTSSGMNCRSQEIR